MAGRGLDTRVTVHYRPDGTGDLTERCAFWAGWVPAGATRKIEAGGLTDGIDGTLKVRDTPAARAVVQSDRARFRGQDCEILSVSVPNRTGWLWLKVGRQLGGGG